MTDANVILSRIDHNNFLGGKITLDLEAARIAMKAIGDQLGLSVEQTAKAIIDIANNNVASELRRMAVGKWPRPAKLLVDGIWRSGAGSRRRPDASSQY